MARNPLDGSGLPLETYNGGFEMNQRLAVDEEPSDRPEAVACRPSAWHQAQELIRDIKDHFPLVPQNFLGVGAAARLVDLQRLLEQLPAILGALRQVHEEQDKQVVARTVELSETNAELTKEIADSTKAKRRLGAEHAVAHTLAESIELANAAAMILQNICQGLGWDVGALWALDQEAGVLRCVDVWHAPNVVIPVFERVCRQHAFSPGIGLPGRVWAIDSPVWISDVTQDAGFPPALVPAREGLHAAVGFPIRSAEFLGVMEFFSLKIRQPDNELLQMMTSIGSHIGQFMERMKTKEALDGKEAELRTAKKIQLGLVAKAPPILAGFDIAGASYPAVETGGDYFDFFPLLDSCQGLVIADASGHGLGPALLITETRAYLRAFALTSEDIGRIVALVNRRLVEDVGEDFVTLFFARLDPRSRSFVYTSAGHVTGCVLDQAGIVKNLLESTSHPLGIVQNADFPIAASITLQPGDLVLLLTDGIVEACAPGGNVFGFQRALDLVRTHQKDAAAKIVNSLYHAVRTFSNNNPQVDDITAMVIKSHGDTASNGSSTTCPEQTPSGDGPGPGTNKEILGVSINGPPTPHLLAGSSKSESSFRFSRHQEPYA